MELDYLQNILKLESDLIADFHWNINFTIPFEQCKQMTKLSEMRMGFRKIVRNMRTFCYNHPSNSFVRVEITSKIKQIKSETLSNKIRDFLIGYITCKIYHKIPSPSNSTIFYDRFNSEIQIEYHLASKDQEQTDEEWCISCYQNEFHTFLNQAFETCYKTSECNEIVYFHYDNLEFVMFGDEFKKYQRFRHYEGDVYVLELSDYIASKFKVEEDLDFDNTDGAMSFTIQKI